MAAGRDGLGREDRHGGTRDLRFSFNIFGLTTRQAFAGQLRASRERWGFSYITVHAPFMEAFAPVIGRLRAR